MKIDGKLVKGIFQKRLIRFLAGVILRGKKVSAYLPNPGRMKELLFPGKRVLLKEIRQRGRKTSYDLIGVDHQGEIVSVDSRVPNRLILEALKKGNLREFIGYKNIIPEYKFGSSQFDFFLTKGKERCLLEVKSCTLVEDGRALFPDAPTLRGKRHLLELIKAKRKGYRACVLFVVQRKEAKVFSPNDKTDREFGIALRKAAKEGVEVYAYLSEFNNNEIRLKGRLKVDLQPSHSLDQSPEKS